MRQLEFGVADMVTLMHTETVMTISAKGELQLSYHVGNR